MEEKIKTVAIFMGLFQDAKGFWGFKNTPERQRCHSDRIKDIYQYDRDWNLLMEVVEKIYQTDLYYDKYINFNSSMFTTGKIELSTNIKEVYNQCVKFINFYNKQKEE